MNYKIGLGQDSHKFDKNKPLMLGGVKILNHAGLRGNSDGDAVLHAIFNAISSALGQGSIGKYADPLCLEQGITDSKEYLKIALEMIKKDSWQIGNVSISIEAKTPKIEPYVEQMKAVIAGILKIKADQVGITATSGEGLTACGRGEGIGVIVVVILQK